jgi:hypothetical protein
MNERIRELAEESGMTQYVAANNKYLERFAELLVQDYAKKTIQGLMSDPAFVQAMDEHYENKWSHRFD